MSTFKQYAKSAKTRLKSGFWEKARQDLDKEKEVAATLGIDSRKVVEEQRRKLEKQIYDYDGYRREQEFYRKVEEILQSDQVVSNPIMRLADQDYMATLTPSQRQAYLAKVAANYQQAVDRYRSLHGN